MTKFWFTPAENYAGPPIELVCGRHTAAGRFIPKNVKLTPGIGRLSRYRYRLRMAGDPSANELEIYQQHMREKRGGAK